MDKKGDRLKILLDYTFLNYFYFPFLGRLLSIRSYNRLKPKKKVNVKVILLLVKISLIKKRTTYICFCYFDLSPSNSNQVLIYVNKRAM